MRDGHDGLIDQWPFKIKRRDIPTYATSQRLPAGVSMAYGFFRNFKLRERLEKECMSLVDIGRCRSVAKEHGTMFAF